MYKKLLLSLILICSLFSLSGCGSGGSTGGYAAPVGSTITVDPATVTVTDTTSTQSHTELYNIVVKDKNGIPMNNVELQISYIWALPDIAGYVQFYHNDAPVNSPFNAKTDKYGAYKFKTVFSSGGIAYSGSIMIFSGSVSGSATFEVKASST